MVDSRAREMDGLGGRGLEVILEADVMLERARFENNAEVAMLVDLEARLTGTDLVVRDTQPRLGVGRALNIQGGSTFDGERMRITGSSEVGIFGVGSGTRISVSALHISGTLARDCPDESCLAGAGVGIVVMDRAVLDTTDFLLAENELAGLQLADADVMWTDGVVRDHPIGVNIQLSDIDPSQLTDNVVYIGNGQNLDASELPLPAPAASASR